MTKNLEIDVLFEQTIIFDLIYLKTVSKTYKSLNIYLNMSTFNNFLLWHDIFNLLAIMNASVTSSFSYAHNSKNYAHNNST